MGYIHCCGGLHKTRSFVLSPAENFVVCEMDYLAKCPNCQHTVLQLTRVDGEQNVSTVRYVNDVARKYFQKFCMNENIMIIQKGEVELFI